MLLLIVSSFLLATVTCEEPIGPDSSQFYAERKSLCDPHVDGAHQQLHRKIWTTIVMQDHVLDHTKHDHSKDKSDHYIILNSTTKIVDWPWIQRKGKTDVPPVGPTPGSNIEMMKKIFTELFSHPRNDEANSTLKNISRHGIVERLSHYTLETSTQEFFAKASDGTLVQGMNIIGVLPGKNRNKAGDDIILIGAHYDTAPTSPGVDDNGSGVVALLEIARMLSPHIGHLSSTIMLVAFDLEDKGVLGSLAFVNNYLVPDELAAKRSHFVGAYILESILNFDNNTQSQILPLDMVMAVPESAIWLQMNSNRGDFVSMWSRKILDWQISNAFTESWRKVNDERNRTGLHALLPETPMYSFDAPIPRDPLLLDSIRYRIFFNGDHASFWAHKSAKYPDDLSAVLITDMGAYRGNMRACHREFCDDTRMLSIENMEFMKRIVDAVASAVLRLSTK